MPFASQVSLARMQSCRYHIGHGYAHKAVGTVSTATRRRTLYTAARTSCTFLLAVLRSDRLWRCC